MVTLDDFLHNSNTQTNERNVGQWPVFPFPPFFYIYVYTRSYGGVVGTPRPKKNKANHTQNNTALTRDPDCAGSNDERKKTISVPECCCNNEQWFTIQIKID